MNNIQKNHIGWLLIVLIVIIHVAVNNIVFLRINKQESENNINALSEIIDDFKVLLDNNQSRLEKKIFDFKKSLHIQYNQADNCDLRYKNLAKLLLSVVKMKNSLLKEAKFDNQIPIIKTLVSDLNDQDIENALNELESIQKIDTINELKVSFEKAVDAVEYSNSTLFKKFISNWIKIKNKNDLLRVKWSEVEDSINAYDWHSMNNTISNLTHSEFKLWVTKLNNFVSAYRNILIIYNHLLQYIP